MKYKKKSELNKNFTKLTQKRGISLIVLIVTIIVIIILAAAVILTVGKNNPVESAREATFKEDVRSFQDELALSISKDYTKKAGQRDTKFNATTLEEIQSYIPSFSEKYKEKFIITEDELIYVEEKVSENEKKWLTDITITAKPVPPIAEEVNENATNYYGKRITNYSANGVTDWKIFHSDGKNVYIIASDYVDVSKLPKTSAGHKPANTNISYPKAAQFDNVIGDYTGSANITDEKIKGLNSDYFSKGYTSTNSNMKAVAYMLDTGIWSSFASEKAEYAIGGPTVEMLMASYSKKYEDAGKDYKARASSSTGYEISKDGGTNWATGYSGMLSTSDSLYVITSQTNAAAMWLASPSANDTYYVMSVYCSGDVKFYYYGYAYSGFRPLVCLKSDIQLEADGDGYKIK